jgi:hypothetical protein
MKAFHGKLAVKKEYLARVVAHTKADEVVKGKYWEEGKGCAVGCTIHSSDHSAYERELGIPEWLAKVEDRLFEGMPAKDAQKWPAAFLKAIKPGANLEKVKTPFIVFILESSLKSMNSVEYDKKQFPQVVAVIAQCETAVKEMIRRHKKGLDLKAAASAADSADSAYSAAASAASAAYSAADSAADSAAASAAHSAASAAHSAAYSTADSADSAAYSAAYSAASAAYSAAASAAASTASAAYLEFSKKLLQLLKECK